jgi:hypothetical protein
MKARLLKRMTLSILKLVVRGKRSSTSRKLF